ncbi:DUF4012 domain-containing protein [Patescibacteria group bacterium]|nr:DUF4012 domain-containing protein [Patescibacteria group bacterium]MBU1868659.1 DUF4012 domain-containing protein [Patescibacteria group bacterium]
MENTIRSEINFSTASVLIAGVGNFVGYHLADSLLTSDVRVIGIDNFITGSEGLVQGLCRNPRFSFFQADINQPLPAALYKEEVSHVIHLANIETCTSQGHLQLNELLSNSFGVKNLLDFSIDKKAPFVFTSTIDIYQGLASSTSLSHYFNGEGMANKLTYAEAKRYAESLCQEYVQLYGADVRVARLSEVYGPWMRLDRGTAFSELLRPALLGEDLVVLTSGTSNYYLTYVSDVVYGLVKLIFAQSDLVKQGIFYFVNPQEVNLVDIAHTLVRLSAKGKVRIEGIVKEGIAFPSSRVDLSRSQHDLYWGAKVNLEEGLGLTLAYFRDYPDLRSVDSFSVPQKMAASSSTETQRDYMQYQAAKEVVEDRLEQPEIQPSDVGGALPQPPVKDRIMFGLKSMIEKERTDVDDDSKTSVPGTEKEAGKDKGARGWLALKRQEEVVPGSGSSLDVPQESLSSVHISYRKKKWKGIALVVSAILILFSFVLLPLIKPFFWGWQSLREVRALQQSLLEGNLEVSAGRLGVLQKDIALFDRSLSSVEWFCRLMGKQPICESLHKLLSVASFAGEGGDVLIQALQEGELLFAAIQSASPALGGEESAISEKVQSSTKKILVDFESAQKRFSLARAELSSVDAVVLPSSLSGYKIRGEEMLTEISSYLSQAEALFEYLPQLLGIPQQQSYFVLLQNSSELRATGGFIGSYATFTFEQGKLMELKVDDIYNPDGQLQDTEPAPKPIKDNFKVENLGIRDANWWPHFPTSAQKIIDLYQQAVGEEVDLVVGLNLYTIGQLLDKVGPVNLADYQETISGENLFEKAELYSEVGFQPGSDQKKSFLTALSQDLIAKLLQADNTQCASALGVLLENLEDGSVMLYSSSEDLQTVFNQLGWSGRIAAVEKEEDYIAVVDSNVGGNKANFWIERSTDYRLDVDRDGNLTGVLTISWVHRGDSGTWPGGDYKNYLRVYVPEYAVFIEAAGFAGEVEKYTEFNKKVFGAIVDVPVNSTKEVILKYSLPWEIGFSKKTGYRLTVKNQPGIMGESFNLIINLPVFLKGKSVNGGLIDADNNRVVWETILDGTKTMGLEVDR